MKRALMIALLAIVTGCSAPQPAVQGPSAGATGTEGDPAVLLIASEATEGTFVEVACAGAFEGSQCMEAIPLSADLTVMGGAPVAIAGPTTLEAQPCGGPTAALEMVEPTLGWAVWPSDVSLLAPPESGVSAEARHADKADIAKALATQPDPFPASVTKLVAAVDLDADGMDDRVYRLGSDETKDGAAGALAILITSDPSRVTFVGGEDGGTIMLQGVVDLDGDKSYELLLMERWADGFEFLVAGAGGVDIEVFGAWGCSFAESVAPDALDGEDPVKPMDPEGTP